MTNVYCLDLLSYVDFEQLPQIHRHTKQCDNDKGARQEKVHANTFLHYYAKAKFAIFTSPSTVNISMQVLVSQQMAIPAIFKLTTYLPFQFSPFGNTA